MRKTPQRKARWLMVLIAVFFTAHIVACSEDDPVVPRPAPGEGPPAWEWQNPLPQGNHLTDVSFFDARTGVAVGTWGTILQTTDGGLTWEARSSGTTVDLSAISVGDSTHGIVVGGSRCPGWHCSRLQ